MARPHVLVVGNGREMPTLLHDIEPEARTTVLVRVAKARRVRDPKLHARIIGIPHDDGPEWIRVAADIHARDPFDAIGSFSEVDQRHAAAIGEALGLRTYAVETVDWVHDKLAMRRRLAETGVERVAAVAVDGDDAAAADAAAGLGYPVVVKPVAGSASSGVTIVREPAELEPALRWARAAREPDDARLMLERCLEGPELSVEAFTVGGEHHVVALTAKLKAPHHAVELGHVVPGDFSAPEVAAVTAHVERVLDALGVHAGVTHTELILTPEGPAVVETHLRRAGDGIVEAIRDTYGLNLIELHVRQALGQDVRAALLAGKAAVASADRHVALWFPLPGVTGRVTAVDGLDAARAAPGVTLVENDADVGDELDAELLDSRSRPLLIRAVGETPADALARAQAAGALVRYRVT